MAYEYMPEITFFVHRVCTPSWEIIPQLIDFQDLTYVYAGQGQYLVDGVQYDVRPGDLLSIPSHCWREASTNSDDPLRLYAFNYRLYNHQLQQVPLDLPILTHLGIHKSLLYSLATMERVWALKEPTYHLMAASVFLEVLNQIMLAVRVEKSSYGDARVQQVADYVLAHLSRQIHTQELAELVSLHPVYLNSLVQKHTGVSLRSFINRIRVNVAEDAIAHEKLSVNEAAVRCGFSDIFYFSKMFKKIKGYPPSHVKKNRP